MLGSVESSRPARPVFRRCLIALIVAASIAFAGTIASAAPARQAAAAAAPSAYSTTARNGRYFVLTPAS